MNEKIYLLANELQRQKEQKNSLPINELIAAWRFTPAKDYLDFMSEFV